VGSRLPIMVSFKIGLRCDGLDHYDARMTRRRHIVRRVVLAAAVPLLLLCGYIGTWLAVSRAEHDGFISIQTVRTVRPVFAPLLGYSESNRPGARILRELWWLVNPPVKRTFTTGSGSAVLTGWIVFNSPIAPPQPEVVPSSGRPE
jgi:hypothetical protein